MDRSHSYMALKNYHLDIYALLQINHCDLPSIFCQISVELILKCGYVVVCGIMVSIFEGWFCLFTRTSESMRHRKLYVNRNCIYFILFAYNIKNM